MPALLVPGQRREVVTTAGVELGIFQRGAGGQDAGQPSTDQLAGHRGLELVTDRDLPAGREEPVDVSRGRVMR